MGKLMEAGGAVLTAAGLASAGVGALLYGVPTHFSSDWLTDSLLWGGGVAAVIGIVASLAGRTMTWWIAEK